MSTSEPIRIPVGSTILDGDLVIPAAARGLVLFAHGSGSSRHSSRNRYVAEVLQEAGFATLLMDLLTRDEEAVDLRTAELRFDIPLLARRVVAAIDWLSQQPEGAPHLPEGAPHLPVFGRCGLFGASTGAAAALIAAAERLQAVAAVVSRGGRPDLAAGALPRVQAPTLLIVGSLDLPVIEMNRTALAQLRCEKQLTIVPGATHLFEEPGTLEEVARLARDWFEVHLSGKSSERVA